MEDREKLLNDLYDVILKLNTRDDCKVLFDDLCTKKELEQMAQRIKAATLLKNGCTYNEVMEQTEISSATLSRVSRSIKYGEGYKKFIG